MELRRLQDDVFCTINWYRWYDCSTLWIPRGHRDVVLEVLDEWHMNHQSWG
jgi:hypothetical protein